MNKLHIWLAKSSSEDSLIKLMEEPYYRYNFWLEDQLEIEDFLSELCGATFLGDAPSVSNIVTQIPYEYLSEKLLKDILESDIDLRQVNSLVTLVSTERDNLFNLNNTTISSESITLWYLNSYNLIN